MGTEAESNPKKNCWEFFSCGRDIFTPDRKGSVCPVSITSANNTVNGGINAGRRCWRIMGTFCAIGQDNERGSFFFKEEHCQKCDFRRQVEEEEGKTFVP